MTVYRCFGGKRGLLRAVCEEIAGLFQRASRTQPDDSLESVDQMLHQLAEADLEAMRRELAAVEVALKQTEDDLRVERVHNEPAEVHSKVRQFDQNPNVAQ